jgi:hypothetical protein
VTASAVIVVVVASLLKDDNGGGGALLRRCLLPVTAFTALGSLAHPSVLKHTLDSPRWAPGEGLEPSSPEGHQLARHNGVSQCI